MNKIFHFEGLRINSSSIEKFSQKNMWKKKNCIRIFHFKLSILTKEKSRNYIIPI